MANKELTGNYKDTSTYKNADGQTRTKIERFKKENKISFGRYQEEKSE